MTTLRNIPSHSDVTPASCYSFLAIGRNNFFMRLKSRILRLPFPGTAHPRALNWWSRRINIPRPRLHRNTSFKRAPSIYLAPLSTLAFCTRSRNSCRQSSTPGENNFHPRVIVPGAPTGLIAAHSRIPGYGIYFLVSPVDSNAPPIIP